MPGQEFHDALVIESTRTQNIVAAFVTMASPRSTPDAEEAVRRLQQTTAEVGISLSLVICIIAS